MINRSSIKFGLTGALLAIVLGAVAACADLPTAAGDNGYENCIIIDGVIHCAPDD